jgi:hypothetical protein
MRTYTSLCVLALASVAVAQPPAEPKLNSAAAKAFTSKALPVVANVCADCHAHAKHTSGFKLKPFDPAFHDPQTADANFKAISKLIDTAKPHDSPLLTYASTAHGKATEPPLKAGHPALKNLELWVHWAASAEGTPALAAVPPPPADKAVVQAGGTQPVAEPAKLPPVKATPVTTFAKPDATKPNPTDPFDPAGFNKK